MTTQDNSDLLWWVLPGELAGMPIPYVHQDRRGRHGGKLDDFDDDLPVLYGQGIRSVVCLLNIPSDKQVYEAAGFSFLCSPVANYQPPEMAHTHVIVEFMRQAPKAVAVHCEGSLGRTGTLLAAYLINDGLMALEAIQKVRSIEPAAIETRSQENFLRQYEFALRL